MKQDSADAAEAQPITGEPGEEAGEKEGGEEEIPVATAAAATTAIFPSEDANSAVVVGDDDDSENAVNDFKSEIVDGRALYFCSECNYQR